jgi:CRISPR-associated protein Cmr2
MKYLFLLTITPVQDFISQARKLKDLYGGSHILSEMSKAGIEYAQNSGATVIFPQKGEGNNSYPNRFLIEISFDNESKLRDFAKSISDEILNYFRGLDKTKNLIVKQHIEDFFQIYWSASEYDEDYKEAFDEVEKRLAGAKNSRFFTQLGEVGRKCSICGERNIAVYKKPMRFYIEEQRKNLLSAKREDNLQHGEGRCSVCYVKRRSIKKGFDSTAEIAIMNIPLEIREQYNYLHNDSQLFYEENLNKSYFEKNDIEYPLDDCLKEFHEFKKAIKKEYKQTSYYAVVMFDGDDMGKWLSGQRLDDKSKLKEFHQDISLNLATFANKARDILKEPKGMTVYAGGEDFLGFVNLNNLFDVLAELNSQFRELIGEPLKEKYQLSDDFTFSAGVVIAHYKTPLGTVLNEARKSEKKAKKNSGKDSVCLTALKRSGEIREAIVKHKKIKIVELIVNQLKENFSDSFISNLEREFLIMLDDEGDLNLNKSLITTEIGRLLKRSKKKEDVNIDEMKELVSALYRKSFRDFSDALNIAKFINREIS